MTATATTLLVGPLGVQELLLILLIIVFIFGASKLPQMGKGLGEGIRNFKKGLKSEDSGQALEDGNQADENTN